MEDIFYWSYWRWGLLDAMYCCRLVCINWLAYFEFVNISLSCKRIPEYLLS